MEKFFSKIIGMPVIAVDYMQPISVVRDILIDPDNGKVIAFVVDSKKGLVVSPIDIISLKHGVWIKDEGDIAESSDILRVSKVLGEYGSLFGKKVITEDGKMIGKIVDFSIDDKFLSLLKIYTSKTILGILQYDSRVIPSKNIVMIEKSQVTVKSDDGKMIVAEKAKEVMPSAV